MTLFLSVISSNVAIQVSDTRVTYFQNSLPVRRDDEWNKAVVYRGRVAFAYTGAAEVEGVRTDAWIQKVLGQSRSLDDGLPLLRDRGTKAFETAGLNGQALTIVGVGYRYVPPTGDLRGFVTIVSNSFLGGWLDEPRTEFKWSYEMAPADNFGLFVAGQPISADVRSELTRNLKRSMDRRLDVRTGIRLMVDVVRHIAQDNPFVGENLMISCIPRSAVPKSDATQFFVLEGEPTADAATFQYLPASESSGISYEPRGIGIQIVSQA